MEKKKILYTIRRSKRAKRMRLAVYRDGSVVVTTPHDLKETLVESFIREKARWIFSKIAYFSQFKGGPIARYSNKDYLKYKIDAGLLIEERVEYFNKQYGFQYNKINIKNQKTRWGSCSQKGNLNFNYKLLFLPDEMRDYVIVHEVCHLKELNHSSKFWDLVKVTFPDYLGIRKELRRSSIEFG